MRKLLALAFLLIAGTAFAGTYTPNAPPTVLSGPSSLSPGASQAAGLDAQGGLIPATGLRVAAVTCSSACTTFGSGSNGVLFTTSTWPYADIDVDMTSVGSSNFIFEGSNDNPTACASSTSWSSVTGNFISLASNNLISTGFAAGHYSIRASFACFRVRVSVYVSGTVTGGAYLTFAPPGAQGVNVQGSAAPSTPAGALASVTISDNPYPSTASVITAVGTATTGAATATLAASSTKFTYICSVTVSAIGGTAAIGPVTITNLMGNTFTYQLASSASGNQFSYTFPRCIPTNAINTSIVITTTADGTASAVDINASGFQL